MTVSAEGIATASVGVLTDLVSLWGYGDVN